MAEDKKNQECAQLRVNLCGERQNAVIDYKELYQTSTGQFLSKQKAVQHILHYFALNPDLAPSIFQSRFEY